MSFIARAVVERDRFGIVARVDQSEPIVRFEPLLIEVDDYQTASDDDGQPAAEQRIADQAYGQPT